MPPGARRRRTGLTSMAGMTKRFLVCGGRDFDNAELVDRALSFLRNKHPDFTLVHGACRGADLLAAGWAKRNGITDEPHPADWSLGRKAGPLRNKAMLESGIDGVIAFPGGRGTQNMLQIARDNNTPVWVVNNGTTNNASG